MRKLVPPRPCPIVPSKMFHGIEASRCFLFQSAMCPLKLDFYASDKHTPHQHHPYSVIYKSGDDVRQDQLVLQIITLMDNLLKQVNLDFKFTAYKTLAFSKQDGMLEFVNGSKTV